MKAYKLEVLVIDTNEVGIDCVLEAVEESRYVSIDILEVSEADIGEWMDDHPLNKHSTKRDEYNRLFKS